MRALNENHLADPFAHVPDAMIKGHEALTTPDSEDLTLVADGKRIHILSFKESDTSQGRAVNMSYYAGDLELWLRSVQELKPGHNFGCFTVMIANDAETRGAFPLLFKLAELSKPKGFNVTTILGRVSTKKMVSSLKSRMQVGGQRA